MPKEIKWGNINVKGLSDLSDYNMQKLAGIETGNNNVKSGHLRKISIKGGKARAKTNHINNVNKSLTSERRSTFAKKQISKSKVEQALKKFIFNKDAAKDLGITVVTFRKLLKEYNLYKKESGASKFMKHFSEKERSKILNKNKNK